MDKFKNHLLIEFHDIQIHRLNLEDKINSEEGVHSRHNSDLTILKIISVQLTTSENLMSRIKWTDFEIETNSLKTCKIK